MSAEAIPPFVDSPVTGERRRAARPTAREWRKHALLLAATVLTTTFAGIIILGETVPEPVIASPKGLLDYVLYVPEFYLKAVWAYLAHGFANPGLLAQAAMFSGALLSILAAHEAGHYVACRRYGVDATLPFFIPAPPLFLTGTFGAFIKIKSPIPSRRALFDIGVAGPLAGFVVALPVALIGILTARPAPTVIAGPGELIVFGDPLLMQMLARVVGSDLNIQINPFYFAAWLGLLVTSLNLMPVGQLDGGHATYALCGRRAHAWVGRAAFAMMATLAVLGWVWYSSPSGFLYAVLLAVILRLRHPQVLDESEPLGPGRTALAAATLAVFVLSFLPFPIKIL